MSFIYSRALVEEFSRDNSLAEDACALSNASPTPRPCLWHDRTTGLSPLSRFGMTCALLTEDHGVALLTWWQEASPAKTSVPPVLGPVLMENAADSGRKWHASFARYDREKSNWKTPQCSLLGDSDEFSETWPRWGSMRNGVSYLRPIPVLPICASVSGLWQMPVADDAVEPRRGKWNSRGEPKLSAEAKLWPTPKANDAEKRGNFDLNNPRNGLPAAAKKWPTPCASASKGSSPASLTRKDGKSRVNDRIDHAVMASDNGQLNPEWVEWLMGWPIGHTALEPLATDRYREWLRQHGGF